ncbi:hypothetical protein [Acetobacter vaccinii]|uniref:Uncharacterized protein n=1 Tax=Acetobacter vaccinii TaxID=2592655 RepID=A0A5C1YR81_9PROT|nr:hypothetical protein [Acetobacter vaccinii]QEO18864.1 hypothetical protein FLP30_13435 [Acetobacter vaccinii]
MRGNTAMTQDTTDSPQGAVVTPLQRSRVETPRDTATVPPQETAAQPLAAAPDKRAGGVSKKMLLAGGAATVLALCGLFVAINGLPQGARMGQDQGRLVAAPAAMATMDEPVHPVSTIRQPRQTTAQQVQHPTLQSVSRVQTQAEGVRAFPAQPAMEMARPAPLPDPAGQGSLKTDTPAPMNGPQPDAPIQAAHEDTAQDSPAQTLPTPDVAQGTAPHPAPQTISDDRLLIAMSQKLEAMATQVASLTQKLDDTQKTLNDRLTSGLGRMDGRLDELQHREDMQMQSRTLSKPTEDAAQAPKPPAPAHATPAHAAAAAPHHDTPRPTPRPSPAPLPRYTVQAGAPDIAILADASGNPVRIQPGSDLGPWGSVLSISDVGGRWQVRTERGVIH